MSDIVQLVPRPPAPDQRAEVHAFTVATLKALLARAEAGEIVSVVAISWQGTEPPRVDMSTEDRITALGAIRTMEHCLVRDWLDGRVVAP